MLLWRLADPLARGPVPVEMPAPLEFPQVTVGAWFFDIVKNEYGSETGLTTQKMRYPSKSASFLVIKQEGRVVHPSWAETPRPH